MSFFPKLPEWPFHYTKKVIHIEIHPNTLKPHDTIIKKLKIGIFSSKHFSITKDCITNAIITKPLH